MLLRSISCVAGTMLAAASSVALVVDYRCLILDLLNRLVSCHGRFDTSMYALQSSEAVLNDESLHVCSHHFKIITRRKSSEIMGQFMEQ
jgi:hypothetical protein